MQMYRKQESIWRPKHNSSNCKIDMWTDMCTGIRYIIETTQISVLYNY